MPDRWSRACTRTSRLLLLALLPSAAITAPAEVGDEALIAVAANFAETAEALTDALRAQPCCGGLRIVSGSTGKLYAQILNGAPYAVFLAADAERPARLAAAGLTAEGPRTYAAGRLALWRADATRTLNGAAALRSGDFRHLAIANPDLAPYGRATLETLAGLGLEESLRNRLVRGENVGQAFAMTASGAAELGFVALSQLCDLGVCARNGGNDQVWIVPDTHHAPIRQDAVLLRRAGGSRAATTFYDFLWSPQARTIISKRGYDLPAPASD